MLTVVSCTQPTKIVVTQQNWATAMTILDCQVSEPRQHVDPQAAASSPTQLQPGEIRYIKVYAENPANLSGVEIKQGQSYQFALSPLNVWFDRTVEANPIVGWKDDLSLWLRVIRWLGTKISQSPSHDLMVLMGRIQGNSPGLFAFKDHIEWIDTNRSKAGGTFIAPSSGELTLFANDVKGKYKNNRGYLLLRLQLAPL